MQFSSKDAVVVRSLSVKLNSRGNAVVYTCVCTYTPVLGVVFSHSDSFYSSPEEKRSQRGCCSTLFSTRISSFPFSPSAFVPFPSEPSRLSPVPSSQFPEGFRSRPRGHPCVSSAFHPLVDCRHVASLQNLRTNDNIVLGYQHSISIVHEYL